VLDNSGNIDTVGSISATGAISTDSTLSVGTTTTLNSIAYTWPGSESANYVLTTNGSGTLTWEDATGISGALSETLTDTYVFVGNGSNVATGVDMTGDIAITNAGVTAVQANAVALTTDTTGDYVTSVTNGTYITGGDGGSEGAALTLDVTVAKDLVTTAPLTGGTDNIFPGADADITIAMPVATTSADGYLSQTDWDTFNDKMGTTLTAANVLVGNASNVATGVAMTGDIAITNAGVTAVQANAVALTTDTTGNYVTSITNGTSIT
ncbi:MAG: hypothetical protein GY841_14870, partial [FCB group bacterium]|nr:hypothetical protein [FCB group bacterium]